MIEVTRLNGHPMLLNSDLIKLAEASPDTMLTLIHGEKLIVRETCAEILDKILAYRAQLLASVAAQGKSDLHRLAALTSHNPDAFPNVPPRSTGAVLTMIPPETKSAETLR